MKAPEAILGQFLSIRVISLPGIASADVAIAVTRRSIACSDQKKAAQWN